MHGGVGGGGASLPLPDCEAVGRGINVRASRCSICQIQCQRLKSSDDAGSNDVTGCARDLLTKQRLDAFLGFSICLYTRETIGREQKTTDN